VVRPLHLVAALAGLAGGLGGARPAPAPKTHLCANGKRGKLQGPPGKRYCTRCAWFEAGARERFDAAADALVEKFGGPRG
jgi:hypothetical protein